MRPQEKWMRNPKDPNQKKKRAYRPKSKRVAAKKGQDDDSKSDIPDQGSEGSSPADGATEAELEGEDDRQRSVIKVVEPELPPMHGRAMSTGPTRTVSNAIPIDPALAEPERRAFHSSPLHNEGSHSHSAEVDLTPKPLRRQLFPSPTNKTTPSSQAGSVKAKTSQPLSELPNFCRRSPRLNNKSVDAFGMHTKTPDAAQKENQVAISIQHDDLNDLFHNDDYSFQLPPQTPTPTRRSDRLLLKTPTKGPSHNQPTTPRNLTSFNSHQALQGAKTPKSHFMMGSNRTLEEMTPGTHLIHDHLVADIAAKNKQMQEQPLVNFSNQPGFNELSPASQQFLSFDNLDDFYDMNADFPEMFRADLQSLTSVPNGLHHYPISDHPMADHLNADVFGPSLTSGQGDGRGCLDLQNKQIADSFAAPTAAGLRRSPRKNKAG
jgi:hypothetical protein